jgi:HEXXH motif-containing protein
VASLTEPWRLPGLEIEALTPPPHHHWLASRLAPPPTDIADALAAGGLRVAPIGAEAVPRLVEAADLLAAHPSFAARVAAYVGAIHLVHADPGYDVSHSEPRWPTRIFVSVPDRADRVGALRLAENVIHEAMHLQLTVREIQTPLVAASASALYSPWRRTDRPAGGVLHGLYVFACLRAFFLAHAEPAASDAATHVAQRLSEIDAEIAEIDLGALAAQLTEDGRDVLAWLRPSLPNDAELVTS